MALATLRALPAALAMTLPDFLLFALPAVSCSRAWPASPALSPTPAARQ
ncbi:hypothetical protein [Pseudomonas sp.]|nr:hypothetical protein [Pseudomonas sp.]HUE93248.1 hypothetical protein [Pseudomonas sp.]